MGGPVPGCRPDGSAAVNTDGMAVFQQLTQSLSMYWCVRSVTQLRLADHLVEGPVHLEQLARAVEVHPGVLYRILRALSSEGIFSEVESKRFALTPAAELLTSSHPFTVRDRFTSDLRWVTDWTATLHTLRTGQPTFEKIHGVRFFDWLAGDPEGGATFNRGMQARSRAVNGCILEAYDFNPATTVVDVGGGTGSLIVSILESYPDVRGVLFDLPHVVEQARPMIEAAGVA
ncbi:MAG TPA: methyltransferase, partial [bacterium]|nr:methyltransferase [bacterium]